MTTKNPIENFHLEKKDIRFLGHDLHRPTSILATQDNNLWITDSRGGVTKLAIATGEQQFIADQSQVNTDDLFSSMLFVEQHTMLLANIGKGCIDTFDLKTEKRKTLYDVVDGKPIGKVNFLLSDSKNRIWVSITTRLPDYFQALRRDVCDGYIALIENGRARIVAEGFSFTNEMHLDASEEYLYIAETMKRCIVRMKVQANGELTHREIFGPTDLGPAGFPDGIAFDDYGNLWGTIVGGERIFALTPQGDLNIIFDDGNPEAIKKIDQAYQNNTLTKEILFSGASKLTPLFTSLTFAGHDLRTVFIGSCGTSLPYFTAPVSGQKC